MRCEDVQSQLALKDGDPGLRHAVDSHLADCPHCRHAQSVYAEIAEVLKEEPVWTPPLRFTDDVIAKVRDLEIPAAVPGRPAWQGNIAAGVRGLLMTMAVYTAGRWLASNVPAIASVTERLLNDYITVVISHPLPVAWTCVALSLGFSAWVTRRAIHR